MISKFLFLFCIPLMNNFSRPYCGVIVHKKTLEILIRFPQHNNWFSDLGFFIHFISLL
ncbi:Hypothetical predicted protein [Olea europaea subsp. europaea]|uniref:Uncharacterized protein n=1 Tax=Olea europaea subsp. europaea TaxID=158383 RepID=A0A8S0QHV9_OLEEU|nr:Hypothetical predicted protein [Olea europaea subsp. europaea]